jgi:hypothetical protein
MPTIRAPLNCGAAPICAAAMISFSRALRLVSGETIWAWAENAVRINEAIILSFKVQMSLTV